MKGIVTEKANQNLSRQTPSFMGYTTEQFRYLAGLRLIEGKEVNFVADEIVGGVVDHVYVRLPDGAVDHHKKPLVSKLIAVPKEWVQVTDANAKCDIPVEDENKVQLLTPWVDGFCAFTTRTQCSPNS